MTTGPRSLGSLAALVRRHRPWTAAAVALIAIVLAGAGWLAFARTGSGRSAAPRQGSSTAKACAQALLADWADGRIDRTYPVSCYREALKTLPTDLEVYSSAPDDIASALRNRIVQGAAVTRHSTR